MRTIYGNIYIACNYYIYPLRYRYNTRNIIVSTDKHTYHRRDTPNLSGCNMLVFECSMLYFRGLGWLNTSSISEEVKTLAICKIKGIKKKTYVPDSVPWFQPS